MNEKTTTSYGLRDPSTGMFVRLETNIESDSDFAQFTFDDYDISTARYERSRFCDVVGSMIEDSRKYFISSPLRPSWNHIDVAALEPVAFVRSELMDGEEPVSGSYHTLQLDLPTRFAGPCRSLSSDLLPENALKTMFGRTVLDASKYFVLTADPSEHSLETGMIVAETLWHVGQVVATTKAPSDWKDTPNAVLVLASYDIEPFNVRALEPVVGIAPTP